MGSAALATSLAKANATTINFPLHIYISKFFHFIIRCPGKTNISYQIHTFFLSHHFLLCQGKCPPDMCQESGR